MKRNEDGSFELTDAERVVKEWHSSLLDTGYSHAAATEQILLRTPIDGVSWEVLKNMEFRAHLAGIKFWGPLAKDDHVVTDEPLPRVQFLDDEGKPIYDAGVRRLGPDLYVIKNPVNDIEHIMTTQEIREDEYVRFASERHDCQPNDLEFQGTIGAPGYGQAWGCKECHAPWVKVGDDWHRADEQDDDMEPPWMLKPEDVI